MNHLLNHTGLNLEAKLLASAHLLSCVNSWQILKFLWHQNGNSNFILKLILVDRLNLACLNLVSTWRQYLNYMCLVCTLDVAHIGIQRWQNAKFVDFERNWTDSQEGVPNVNQGAGGGGLLLNGPTSEMSTLNRYWPPVAVLDPLLSYQLSDWLSYWNITYL